jgi:glycosyltransferase involved in cell wall biosynthesis
MQPVSKWRMFPKFLKAYGYEWTRTHSKRWWLRNFKRFMSIFFTQFALGERLIDEVKKSCCDEDLTFYSYWFSASSLCLSILHHRGLIEGYSARAHALDCYHEAWGLLNERTQVLPFRHYKQRHVSHLYPISQHGKLFLEESIECQGKVEVAYLGVASGMSNPNAQEASTITVVTCSGVDDNKRIHLLGQALHVLDQPIRWVHFGDGPLRELVYQSVEGSQVKLDYRGQTINAQIRRFYEEEHVDLFINVSQVEGLPVTIMEALAHGIPVVATAVNGSPETIHHGQHGWLIPVQFTPQQLAQELKLALNTLRSADARAKARQHFERNFQARVNYKNFASRLK